MSASVTTNLLSHYPHVPLFYFVSPGLDEDTLSRILDSLVITPITYAIITSPSDSVYASQFADQVLLVASDDMAYTLAYDIYTSSTSHDNRSVLIRNGPPLIAVFQNGQEILSV